MNAASVFVLVAVVAGAALVVEKGYADGRLTYAIIAKDYVWNDGANGGGWTDGAKWNVDGAASAWANNNNAVFANAGDVATLDADVAAVKGDGAAVVSAVACEVGTERGFACSRGGLNKIEVSAFEADVLQPEFRRVVRALGKDQRQGVMEGNLIQVEK